MKAIIRGKLYDTEKAELICEGISADRVGVFKLYRTKSGKYFKTFEYYRRFYGKDYLFAVSKRGAKSFVKYCRKQLMENDPDEYIKQFGNIEEA